MSLESVELLGLGGDEVIEGIEAVGDSLLLREQWKPESQIYEELEADRFDRASGGRPLKEQFRIL